MECCLLVIFWLTPFHLDLDTSYAWSLGQSHPNAVTNSMFESQMVFFWDPLFKLLLLVWMDQTVKGIDHWASIDVISPKLKCIRPMWCQCLSICELIDSEWKKYSQWIQDYIVVYCPLILLCKQKWIYNFRCTKVEFLYNKTMLVVARGVPTTIFLLKVSPTEACYERINLSLVPDHSLVLVLFAQIWSKILGYF